MTRNQGNGSRVKMIGGMGVGVVGGGFVGGGLVGGGTLVGGGLVGGTFVAGGGTVDWLVGGGFVGEEADGGLAVGLPRGPLVLVGGMSVQEGATVCEGAAEAVKEGVRVGVSVDVGEGVLDGVDVCEAVAVGEKVGVGVDVAVAVGSRLPANAVSSPAVFGIITSASASSGWEDFHRRFGTLKAHMAIIRRSALIK